VWKAGENMALRNLLVRVGADLSGLQKGMKQANSQIAGFGKGVKRSLAFVGAALAAVGSVAALKPAIDDAIKYEALMGTIGETLGSTANDFVKWSETTGAAMGFSKLAAAEMANTFSLKFKGIAKDAQDNFRMTTEMMKAAAIVRTKTGMQEVEIMDRMRSAMNQEADGADELGVNVRVAAITASNAYKQMANGVPWADLSKNQQTLILQAHITESIYSKLGNTVANNTALLKGQFLAALNDTKLALGQAFLPILNIALPLLTSLMRKVESAFKFFAGFMRAMFPKSNIKAGNEQVKSLNTQTSSIGKQKGAVDGLTKSVKNLGKAKKKASNGVAGFDQVNTLSSTSADSGSGGSGGAGDVFSDIGDGANDAQNSVDDLGDIIAGVTDKIKAYVAKFKEWLKPIKPYWDDLVESLKNIGGALSDVWNSPSGKKLKTWLTSGWDLGISGLLEILAGFGNTFAGLIRLVYGGLTGDWKLMWEGAGDIIKGVIEILNGTFGPLFPKLMEKVKEFTDGFKEKWDAVLNIDWLALGVEVLKAFVQLKKDTNTKLTEWKKDISTVWTDIKKGASAAWENVKKSITGKISGAWTDIQNTFSGSKEWFKTNISDKVSGAFDGLSNLGTTIKGYMTKGWSGTYDWFARLINNSIKKPFSKLSDLGSTIKGYLTDGWTGTYDWFATLSKNSIRTPFSKLSDLGSNIKGYLKSGWKGTYDFFATLSKNSVKTPFSKSLSGIGSTIKGYVTSGWSGIGKWFTNNVSSPISTALKGIKNAISGSITGGFKSTYNTVAGYINSLISGINKMVKKLNELPMISGIPTVPKIPYLAKGGIVNSPTLAMVGEAGKEAVMPLENNTGWITDLASMLVARGGTGGGGGDIVMNVDGRTLARIVKPHLDKENKRVGNNIRLKPV
jgi:hypothetical protein